MMDPIIQANNLEKKFGEFVAIKKLNLSISRGKCFGLLGPNGAGKSTFINIAYGAAKKTGGSISVFGIDPTHNERDIKKKLGVVTQENALDESLTVFENMILYSAFVGVPKSKREGKVLELLRYMNLEQKKDAKIQFLSGGMKRRLVFVRALLNDPDLLILDEPTTGLDPAVRHMLWSKVKELRNQNKTILLTTHYMHEAEILCDEVAIMNKGEVVALGTPGVLIAQHAPGFVSMYAAEESSSVSAVSKTHSDLLFTSDSSGCYLRATSLEQLISIQKELHIQPLQLRPANLEDVFLSITGQELSHDA